MPIDRNAKRDELQEALNAYDVYKIAEVFRLPPIKTSSSSSSSSTTTTTNTTTTAGPTISLQDHGLDWTATLTNYCNACDAAMAGGQAQRCYDYQSTAHSNFHAVFSSSSGNWLVPTLHVMCRNTHHTAIAADKEASAKNNGSGIGGFGGGGGSGDANANLQKAVTILQESYSKTSNDRTEYRGPDVPLDEEGSKKAGVLTIVNELFAIYFRLNTLRLCKNLLRPVETRKLHEQGKMSEMVTYKYYVGRIFLFEDQYEMAETNLDYALQHCHKGAKHNKRCILRYLVPVKLYRGHLPSSKLLEKYSLHEFVPIVEGVRTGDLRTFHDGLMQYQDLFIHRGTYLLLEKCKTVCYRNLFKRIHIILEKHQISLNHIAKVSKWLGIPMDLDEVECILANLIFRGYIRGYLSHAKRVLVLSKRDPFPVSAVISSK